MHHLDKRAGQIVAAAAGAEDDELLTTRDVAIWLGVSEQFLNIGRSKKAYGPKYVKLSPTIIRYRRGDVLAWLRKRTHASTVEYIKRGKSKVA